ncbi:MAG: PKD domain-containing protein [Desulfobacteraceae bacterium]|nr:PKD domain-containing protein [Desulfobacteraceae bacterium]
MGQCAMCDSSSCSTPITPSFTASATSIPAGQSVTFTNTSSSYSASWLWTLLNSSSATVATATTQNYTSPTSLSVGTYTVTLKSTPTDTNCSATTTAAKSFTVTQGACTPTVTASFETPPTGTLKEGSRITFKNTSQKGTSAASSTDATWLWTVSGLNGQMSFTFSTMDLEFFPPDAGTYTVKLTATSGGCSSTYPATTPYSFTVAPYCTDFTASITYPTTTTFKVGDSITFNSGTGASKWIWDFGDGSQNLDTSKAQAAHSYGMANSYTVRLTAWDANGCPSNSAAKSIVVNPSCPAVVSEGFTTTGKTPVFYVGDTVTFAYSTAIAPLTWTISKDNGSATTMPNPYTFSAVGQYTVKLAWTDSNSCLLIRQMKVEVASGNATRDYTSDGKISLEDAIYVLQVVSDIRQTAK